MADVETAFALRPVLFRALHAPTSRFAPGLFITGTAPATQHDLICVISAIGPSALSAIAGPSGPYRPPPSRPVRAPSGQFENRRGTFEVPKWGASVPFEGAREVLHPCRDPGLRLRIPNAAAQTRIVSKARIRLDATNLCDLSKG